MFDPEPKKDELAELKQEIALLREVITPLVEEQRRKAELDRLAYERDRAMCKYAYEARWGPGSFATCTPTRSSFLQWLGL